MSEPKDGEFPCTRCALCCRISMIPQATLDEMAFPYRPDADGYCEKLDRSTGLCTVYSSRPRLCSIDGTKPEDRTQRDWHELNARICNVMINMEIREPDPKHPVLVTLHHLVVLPPAPPDKD